ncbi:hypothetical protein ACQ4LE_006673 [Meloidogyne hapla]
MIQYVRIKTSFGYEADAISLPTDNEGNLLIETLNCFGFHGVVALKFTDPATLRLAGHVKDPTGTKFLPPHFGWQNKEFVVVRKQSAPMVEFKTDLMAYIQRASSTQLMIISYTALGALGVTVLGLIGICKVLTRRSG